MTLPTSMFISLLLLLLFPLFSPSVGQTRACTGSRTYRVTYNYLWQAPFKNIPRNAHFSPLVVFAHKATFSAFSEYGYATTGVQDVAETGAFSALRGELDAARADGFVGDVQVDGSVPDGDGSASVTLQVNCSFPYISAISMVAPSPDWIAPVFRFPVIKKKSRKYKKKGKRSVRVWDVGTDSGLTLTARNAPTSPRENIHPLIGAPFDERTIAEFSISVTK